MEEHFLDGIQLKDSIRFNGSIHDLKECIRFKKKRNFELVWHTALTFEILSNFSFGTSTDSFFTRKNSNRIKGFGKLKQLENGSTLIEIKTKTRPELFFFLIVFLIVYVADLLFDLGLPFYIYFLLPFVLVWHWFVYRFQEKRLFEKFKFYVMNDLKNTLQKSV